MLVNTAASAAVVTAAMIVIGCGAGMALLTLGVAALAVNSGM